MGDRIQDRLMFISVDDDDTKKLMEKVHEKINW